MEVTSSQQYANFRAWVPRNVVSVGVQNPQSWIYYDWGPRAYSQPIICIHALIGSAESFFNQIISIAPRGYRVISLQIPDYFAISEYCEALDAFLDMLNLPAVHINATGLGALLAIHYTLRKPDRVLSLVLSHITFLQNIPPSLLYSSTSSNNGNTSSNNNNSQKKAANEQAKDQQKDQQKQKRQNNKDKDDNGKGNESYIPNIPYSPAVLKWLPAFLIKSTIRQLLPKGKTIKSHADAAEFLISQTLSQPRDNLAARLALLVSTKLNLKSSDLDQHQDNIFTHLTNRMDQSRITLIDTLDRPQYILNISQFISSQLPNCRKALLKTGGDFPYLAVPDDMNVHIIVHLRRNAAEPCDPMITPPPARRRPLPVTNPHPNTANNPAIAASTEHQKSSPSSKENSEQSLLLNDRDHERADGEESEQAYVENEEDGGDDEDTEHLSDLAVNRSRSSEIEGSGSGADFLMDATTDNAANESSVNANVDGLGDDHDIDIEADPLLGELTNKNKGKNKGRVTSFTGSHDESNDAIDVIGGRGDALDTVGLTRVESDNFDKNKALHDGSVNVNVSGGVDGGRSLRGRLSSNSNTSTSVTMNNGEGGTSSSSSSSLVGRGPTPFNNSGNNDVTAKSSWIQTSSMSTATNITTNSIDSTATVSMEHHHSLHNHLSHHYVSNSGTSNNRAVDILVNTNDRIDNIINEQTISSLNNDESLNDVVNENLVEPVGDITKRESLFLWKGILEQGDHEVDDDIGNSDGEEEEMINDNETARQRLEYDREEEGEEGQEAERGDEEGEDRERKDEEESNDEWERFRRMENVIKNGSPSPLNNDNGNNNELSMNIKSGINDALQEEERDKMTSVDSESEMDSHREDGGGASNEEDVAGQGPVDEEGEEESEEQQRLKMWSMSAVTAASKTIHR